MLLYYNQVTFKILNSNESGHCTTKWLIAVHLEGNGNQGLREGA